MPVSSRGPRRRRSWWCHTCSSTPSTRTPAKRAGSSDAACRHGLIWDHTVFHVVASCRTDPAMLAPSKRNCRIAQRIARTLGSVLGGVHRTVLLDERHDLSGAFSAYPASYCAIGYAPGPRPKARRSPPPPHARDREQPPHNPGSQHSDHRTLCQAPDHTHAEPRSSDGNPPNRRADHNDQATHSSR